MGCAVTPTPFRVRQPTAKALNGPPQRCTDDLALPKSGRAVKLFCRRHFALPVVPLLPALTCPIFTASGSGRGEEEEEEEAETDKGGVLFLGSNLDEPLTWVGSVGVAMISPPTLAKHAAARISLGRVV